MAGRAQCRPEWIFLDGVVSGSDMSRLGAAAVGVGARPTLGAASSGIPAIAAGSAVRTAIPSIRSRTGPETLPGSGGRLATGWQGSPVDTVLGTLVDDADAPTSAAGSLVRDLALEQIATPGQRPSRRRRD